MEAKASSICGGGGAIFVALEQATYEHNLKPLEALFCIVRLERWSSPGHSTNIARKRSHNG